MKRVQSCTKTNICITIPGPPRNCYPGVYRVYLEHVHRSKKIQGLIDQPLKFCDQLVGHTLVDFAVPLKMFVLDPGTKVWTSHRCVHKV